MRRAPAPKARGYLADRGLDPATQLKFRLGYAPAERFALKEHLGEQGIPVEDMVEAGLLISGDDIPVPYDRFRDRVMFPITDLRGRVIAFGGRALEKDAQAKYLNSPETPLFHKGATLYNSAAARQAAHDGAPLIVVEGYVDVIAMVTAGFPATVAPLGTALTEDQLGAALENGGRADAVLRRRQRRPARGLPRGRSGDAAVQARQEPAVRAAAARAGSRRSGALGRARGDDGGHRRGKPLADMLWARETEGHSFDTPERRAALEARMNEVTAASATKRCGDTTARTSTRGCRNFSRPRGRNSASSATGGNWRDPRAGGSFRERNGGDWQRREAPRTAGRTMPYVVASQQMASSPVHRGNRSTVSRREALILQAALNHPWLLHDHLEEFASLEFRHPDAEKIKGALIDIAAHAPALDAAALKAELAARNLSEVTARIALSITTPSVWGARPEAAPDDVLVTWSQLVALHRQWHSLTKELKDAEQALGQDASEANYLRLRDVKSRLERVEGTEALIEGFGASSGRGVRSL